MPAKWLFGTPGEADVAKKLYATIVTQSRQPSFYLHFGVPDSLDGRFDLISLHVFLTLRRLKADHPTTKELAQNLFDTYFGDLDACLREMGAGDLGVAPRIKKMAQAFYGRMQAYEEALAEGEEALCDALRRNLYGTVEIGDFELAAMAGYLREQVDCLADQAIETIADGQLEFGPPPMART